MRDENAKPPRFETKNKDFCASHYQALLIITSKSGSDGVRETNIALRYIGRCTFFINKVEGGLQELEETIYWLELLGEAGIFAEERLKPLQTEAEELISMFVTMVKNVKARRGAKG